MNLNYVTLVLCQSPMQLILCAFGLLGFVFLMCHFWGNKQHEPRHFYSVPVHNGVNLTAARMARTKVVE